MNIKRAFLIAAAALVLPGYAMAQTTVYFDTDLALNPGGPFADTPSVTATRVCNIGSPLQQSFELTQDGVQFTAENFDAADPTFEECRISITALNGWDIVEVIVGNGEGAPLLTLPGQGSFPDCVYGPATDGPAGVLQIGTENTCEFRMIPQTFTYEVEKVWEFDDSSGVAPVAGVDIYCNNVFFGNEYNNVYPANTMTISGGFNDVNTMVTVSTLRWNPTSSLGTTSCHAYEYLYDSAIESDQGCQAPVSFGVGDLGPKGCTITNTVFFEGIPTLSQYGLAVMALLMLGVGFIGFRRFV